MNRQAVLLAREIMEAVPEEQVDMRVYDCGTHACMLGHMARSGRFLHLIPAEDAPSWIDSDGTPWDGLAAGRRIFGLSQLQRNPFRPPSYSEILSGLSHKAIALARLDDLLAEDAAAEPTP